MGWWATVRSVADALGVAQARVDPIGCDLGRRIYRETKRAAVVVNLARRPRPLDRATVTRLQPLYPDVVGYSEIADMAGVSRQAARLWGSNPTFPPAVIETAQGPLRLKAAVQAWIEANPPRRRRTTNPSAASLCIDSRTGVRPISNRFASSASINGSRGRYSPRTIAWRILS